MPGANEPQDVVFQPGIREDIDPRNAPPGSLTVAQNVRYGRQGGIAPRPGTKNVPATVLGTAHDFTASSRAGFAAKLGSIPLLGVDGKVYTHVPAAAAVDEQSLFAGAYSTAQPRRRRNGMTSENTATGFGHPDTRIAVATTGSSVLIASSDGADVKYRVETFDGVVLTSGAKTGTICSVIVHAFTYYLVIQNGTNLSALPLTVVQSTVTEGTLTLLVTLPGASSAWDITGYDNGTAWYLVYAAAAGNVTLNRYQGLGLTHSIAAVFSGTTSPSVSAWADTVNGNVWVGLHDDPTVTGTVRYAVRAASDLTAVTAATTIATSPLYGPPLFGPDSSTSPDAFFVFRIASSSGSPVTQGT